MLPGCSTGQELSAAGLRCIDAQAGALVLVPHRPPRGDLVSLPGALSVKDLPRLSGALLVLPLV